jgi:hypothetical protein
MSIGVVGRFLLPGGEKVRMRGKRVGRQKPLTLILSPEGRGENPPDCR